jgi:hypothetical protein
MITSNIERVFSLIKEAKVGTSHYLSVKTNKDKNPISRVDTSKALQKLKQQGLVTNSGTIWRIIIR